MNIIVPIGGKGERFSAAGYTDPKPLIRVYNKEMILWVLDNIHYRESDSVFVFYFPETVSKKIESVVLAKHPNVRFIAIPKQTRGAAETLAIGISEIFRSSMQHHLNTMVVDCDTFYRANVRDLYTEVSGYDKGNAVFYTYNVDPRPIFSYIRLSDRASELDTIVEIQEKVKISDNANTGIYCFDKIQTLSVYAHRVVEQNIQFAGECYTSCIIAEMMKAGHVFRGIELDPRGVFNLGTPAQLVEFERSTRVCLFDLDGTLVNTDAVYYAVWAELLVEYGISLTPELFRKSIAGNSDSTVVRQLIPCVSVSDISAKKDALFLSKIENDSARVDSIPGAIEFVQRLHQCAHPMAIVSNANRLVAEELLARAGLSQYFDFIIAAGESDRPKPYPDPYLAAMARYGTTPEHTIIFEDSKTGLMSACSASPGCVVGIGTQYSKEELVQSGATVAATDYTELDWVEVLSFQNTNIGSMKRWIRNSLKTLPISDVRISETKRKGGFIADVYSVVLELSYEGTRTEIACVLKAENANKSALSNMSKELGLYEREYLFYSTLANLMPVPTPKYYGIIRDDHFRTVGIFLEDLTVDGGVVGLDLNTEPLSTSMAIIDQMAHMHAAFWDKDLGTSFPDLKKHNDAMFCPKWGEFVGSRIDAFLAKWGNTLTPEQRTLARTMAETMTETQHALSRGALTLCHGDVKSANLFYRKPDSHPTTLPPERWFIDWQYIAHGKGVQDLVFFIIESFDVDHSRKYRELFKEYYYVKLAEHGVAGYSREEYEIDFRNASRYFPFFVAIWFGTLNDDELLDKNFPFFFIQRLFAFLGP